MKRGKPVDRGKGWSSRRSVMADRSGSTPKAYNADRASSSTPNNSDSKSNTSTASKFKAAGASRVDKCGTCKLAVDDDGIGCDRCEDWFHPSTMCMGLPDSVIDNIANFGGHGVLFVCTLCRLNKSSTQSSRLSSGNDNDQTIAVKQLFEMVSSLCGAVRNLMAAGSFPTAQAPPAPVPSTPGRLTNDELDTRIYEQVREVNERERRRESIIIRGLPDVDIDQVIATFSDISQLLLKRTVRLEDVVCIDPRKGLYRGKVTDNDDRRAIVSESRKLKQSDNFKSVFIHRDLTYKQRQALRARREASGGGQQQQPAGQHPSPGAEAPGEGAVGGTGFLPQ